LYSSPNIIRQIKIKENEVGGARMGDKRNVYKVLVEKPKCRRSLRRRRYRWEDGIRMDLREIGWGSAEWIKLAQDRDRWRALVNTVMDLRVLNVLT
jgi:hypothetical protein